MKLNFYKAIKRAAVTVITISVLMTSTAFASELNITDIQSHWGKSNIEYLISRGSINGYPDGTFRPDGTITRAEFVKIALGSVMPVEIATGSHWATEIFDEAINQEILKIGEMPESNWDKPITRYEMTMIMTRIAEKLLNEEKIGTVGIANILTDYNKVQQNQYYTAYVEQAYMKGLIKGYEDGSFQGTKTGSRAEASTMLARMLDATKREKVDTSVVVVKPPVVVGATTLYQTDATRGEAKAGDTFVKADGTKVVLKVDSVSGVLGAGQGVALDLGRTSETGWSTVTDGYQATGNEFGPVAGEIYRINPNTGEGHWTEDWIKISNTTEPEYSGTTDGELSADKNWAWTTGYRGGSWYFVVNCGLS
jgi:hypothetical protein